MAEQHEEQAASTPGTERKRTSRLRWRLAFFVVLVAVVYFAIIRRYRITRLEIATVEAMAPAMPRGALYLIDRSPPHSLRRDWMVMWSWREGTLFSRVHAVPGDELAYRGGRWYVRDADGQERSLAPEYEFGADWNGRKLAVGEYLLLNDQAGSKWADSRRFGVVDRKLVLVRVVMPLTGGAE